MSKKDLVDAMAEEAGLTKADAERALKAFMSVVTGALKKKTKVTLVGFGTFLTRDRAAREGRNPSTGATVQISARTVVGFKAGSALKDAVN